MAEVTALVVTEMQRCDAMWQPHVEQATVSSSLFAFNRNVFSESQTKFD